MTNPSMQAVDETQALIEHDRWFSDYGQKLGSFYNSLTLHTRAAWVAAAKKYAPVAGEAAGYIHPDNVRRLQHGETVAFRKKPYGGERCIPVFVGISPQTVKEKA